MIHNIQPEDAGEYSCYAENKHNRAWRNYTIKVLGKFVFILMVEKIVELKKRILFKFKNEKKITTILAVNQLGDCLVVKGRFENERSAW